MAGRNTNLTNGLINSICHDKWNLICYIAEMVEFARQLDLPALLAQKSHFLFGPRGTGKTHLVHSSLLGGLHPARIYDLLDDSVFRRLAKRPEIIGEEARTDEVVVIDEVQKLPLLLDEAHRLIEARGIRFLLTGSSARKLRRGGANLLAGRAWTASLLPLTSAEIPDFDLVRYLNRGGLPFVYQSQNPELELASYVDTYLREEIQAEALTRNIGLFARFLDAFALVNGEELAYQALASDTGIQAKTIRNYVEILKDTLIGFEVEAFRATKSRKAIARSRFYLFDIGVTNTLCQRGEIREKSELFGRAFEQLIMLELRAYLSYTRSRKPLCYWRSTSQFEVDAVVGREFAVEVKATDLVSDRDLRGLLALREEGLIKRYCVVSLDPEPRHVNGIDIWPWRHFLNELWRGHVVA
jgi:uncharacterized protein